MIINILCIFMYIFIPTKIVRIGKKIINNQPFPPESIFTTEIWFIYMKSIRTNNDVEGWHHRLNQSARRAQLPMYSLIQLLFDKSTKLSLQVRMLSENKLKRKQKRK